MKRSLRKVLFCVACHVLNCCSYANPSVETLTNLNNAETKKPFHGFGCIPRAFSCALDSFLEIASCLNLFLPHCN